jgi:hypothetical protein
LWLLVTMGKGLTKLTDVLSYIINNLTDKEMEL